MIPRGRGRLEKPPTGSCGIQGRWSKGLSVFWAKDGAKCVCSMWGAQTGPLFPLPKPWESMQRVWNQLLLRPILQDIHLPNASFDVVTLFEVLEHLKDPLSLMQECHRVLSQGGLLVIRTGNTDSWSARFMKNRWEYFSITEHGGHISFFNPVSMGKLAQRSGFLIESLKTHRVSFYQKGEIPYLIYRPAKLLAEVLNTPSTWFGKGHELQVYLRKPN
jgi:SAM-dependent methyltransferase